MSLLRTLAGLFVPPSAGRTDDAERLAGLLLAELRLHAEDAVEKSRREGVLDPSLEPELERAFAIFVDRVGDSEETKAAFLSEAVRQLVPGNPQALETLFSRLERRFPPPTTPR
jgi:hypothetical protein